MKYDILKNTRAIKDCIANDDNFQLTSITTRESIEDTYSWHLNKTGLSSKFRFRVILTLIYWDYKKLYK